MQIKNYIVSLILLEMLSLSCPCSASSGTSETTMTLIVPSQELLSLEGQKEHAAQQGVLISAMIYTSLQCLQSVHEEGQCQDLESWNSI